MNFSADKYTTFLLGFVSLIFQAIACIKCVLPKPTPPYITTGLNAISSDSAILCAAAATKLLDGPMTNLSKVYLGSKGDDNFNIEEVASSDFFVTLPESLSSTIKLTLDTSLLKPCHKDLILFPYLGSIQSL